MSVAVEPVPAEGQQKKKSVLARLGRPALGLAVPLALAAGWEIAVRAGISNGRLVPPPSRIYE
ncbi:MAG: ABC transporter permease, partial [Pseudolabrys sp.]